MSADTLPAMLTDPANCMVRAQATVDHLRNRQYRVTVTGQPPHNQVKIYTISADSDTEAAHIGINRFVKSMSHPFLILTAL